MVHACCSPSLTTGPQGVEGSCSWDGSSQDPNCNGAGKKSEEEEGKDSDIPVMVSGAGHDAMAIADITKVSCRLVGQWSVGWSIGRSNVNTL
jgi:hypothetical protein